VIHNPRALLFYADITPFSRCHFHYFLFIFSVFLRHIAIPASLSHYASLPFISYFTLIASYFADIAFFDYFHYDITNRLSQFSSLSLYFQISVSRHFHFRIISLYIFTPG